MSPEGFALLVASVVGSTGLASFLSAGVKFSRATRLRGAISATKESLDGLDPNSGAYRATQVSISVMALEVASYSLVRVPMRKRALAIAVAILLTFACLMVFYLLAMLPRDVGPVLNDGHALLISVAPLFNGGTSSLAMWFMIGLSVIYILTLAIMLALQTAVHRERFVAEALHRNTVDYALVVEHGHQLKHLTSSSTPDGDSTGPAFGQICHFAPANQLQKAIETQRRPWWRLRAP